MEQVAAAVAVLATPVPGGVLLEVAAGTGEIGCRLAAAGVMPYVGLDLSLPMLERFGSRLRGAARRPRRALIARADADRAWPLAAGCARIVFVSRALHLLDLGRVTSELGAAAHPQGCVLAIGRVRRDPASVRAQLRRRIRVLLAARGVAARSGEGAQRRLLADLAGAGGRSRAAWTAATWTVEERPARVLAAWREKPGLGGATLPAGAQGEVLSALEAWARRRFGDLEAPRPARESYRLLAVDLPARSGVAWRG